VSADEVLARRLDAFLETRGSTRAAVLAAIDEPFGSPLLVVATGSVVHGFGNQRSDLDVNVVVERAVTRLPVGSYAHQVLVDTAYYSTSEVENWISTIRDHPWPHAGHLSREQWKERLAALFHCARLGYGLTLSARDDGYRLMEDFRKQWLGAKVAQWWQIEALRLQLAGRWLGPVKPLLAAQRYFEAALAALERRVATAGQPYFGPKWLSEKLRILADTSGLDALRVIMRMPETAREARNYIISSEAVLEEFGVGYDGHLTAQLSYLSGVKVWELDARSVVSRWNMRAIELRGNAPSGPPQLVWQGALDMQPPADVLALFTGDMTWLSVVATAP
jgi:hypothetical protein